MTTTPSTTPKPRRRWLQVSLRTMLVLVLLISVPLGWLGMKMREAREQQAAAEAIRSFGGWVEYESEQEPADDEYPSVAFRLDARFERRGPAWLCGWLGDDFFVRIIAVNGESDGVLEHAARLPHLSSLSVGPLCRKPFACYPVTDAGLKHLKESSQLRELMLNQTQVTDAGLTHLRGLHQLQHLDLSGTQVTDAGLTHFGGLTQLQYLNLSGTQITDAGIAELQKALPNCEIIR